MSENLFRVAQLIAAILGLVFSITSEFQVLLMIIVFAIAVTYLVIIFICLLAGKNFFGGTTQPIIELAIGITVLVATIYTLAVYKTDTFLVISIVSGFILSALFFISGYEKIH